MRYLFGLIYIAAALFGVHIDPAFPMAELLARCGLGATGLFLCLPAPRFTADAAAVGRSSNFASLLHWTGALFLGGFGGALVEQAERMHLPMGFVLPGLAICAAALFALVRFHSGHWRQSLLSLKGLGATATIMLGAALVLWLS